MSSNITRSQIRSMVIGVIRADLGGEIPVREISRLGEDLGISPDRREAYYLSIKKGVRAYGYDLLTSTPERFRACSVVKDMVDLVWTDASEQTN